MKLEALGKASFPYAESDNPVTPLGPRVQESVDIAVVDCLRSRGPPSRDSSQLSSAMSQ